uniref:Exonuclease domain-containing protein n=1 Tax=Trichogramma kaykai TaxID=54128 RepID=A0ABD2X083_9HYME
MKAKRSSKSSSSQRKEGITYESNIGLSGVLDIPLDCSTASSSMNIQVQEPDNFKLVYFDVETTGLSNSDQICQIAAYDGVHEFSVYSVPTVAMKSKASAKTGLTVKRGELYLHSKKLDTVSRKKMLEDFLCFLESLKGTDESNTKIILIGHNVLRFDAKKIKQLAEEFNLYDNFCNIVYGYTDTLNIFKKLLPERKKKKLSYSEEAMVKEYLLFQNTDKLHDALEDIIVLKKLVEVLEISDKLIIENCDSISSIREKHINKIITLKNKNSLLCLKGKISPNFISKMAKEGIDLEKLKEAYKKDQKDGIKILLSMSVNNKVRVTSSQKCIDIVQEIIKKML